MSGTDRPIPAASTSHASDATAGSRGAAVAEQAQQKAHAAAAQTEQKVEQAAGQLQDRLRRELEQRSSQAGEQINGQASDLRSVARSLREQGQDAPARAAEKLAAYAERAGRYLSEKDSGTMLADAEELGRRQPWAAAAGGLALGFLASRFLKASSSNRYRSLTVARPAGVYPAANGGAADDASRPGTTSQEASERALA